MPRPLDPTGRHQRADRSSNVHTARHRRRIARDRAVGTDIGGPAQGEDLRSCPDRIRDDSSSTFPRGRDHDRSYDPTALRSYNKNRHTHRPRPPKYTRRSPPSPRIRNRSRDRYQDDNSDTTQDILPSYEVTTTDRCLSVPAPSPPSPLLDTNPTIRPRTRPPPPKSLPPPLPSPSNPSASTSTPSRRQFQRPWTVREWSLVSEITEFSSKSEIRRYKEKFEEDFGWRPSEEMLTSFWWFLGGLVGQKRRKEKMREFYRWCEERRKRG